MLRKKKKEHDSTLEPQQTQESNISPRNKGQQADNRECFDAEIPDGHR